VPRQAAALRTNEKLAERREDEMSDEILPTTRRSLHGIAELVLAGPQYATSDDIRLRATPGGFGTVSAPVLRIEGLELVTPAASYPLVGTFAGLADRAGVRARALRDVYETGPDVDPTDPIVLDAAAVRVIVSAFATGDAALRAFAPGHEPVLWPEHFDIAITVGDVNFGVSPGDSRRGAPYAYVGPWTPREGSFWNTPFGAARPLTEIPGIDALAAFFSDGAERAAADPPHVLR
jgi:hypothetical protein